MYKEVIESRILWENCSVIARYAYLIVLAGLCFTFSRQQKCILTLICTNGVDIWIYINRGERHLDVHNFSH